MTVSREDVERMAALARLNLPDDGLDRLTVELNGILGHVRLLEELDLNDVDETVRVTGSSLPFRPSDLVRDSLADGAPARTAPEWREGFFVVPRLPALDGGDVGNEAP